MSFQIFFKQTVRAKTRLWLSLVLLCAVVAFFVISLNLYYNGAQNLHTVENTYHTIAGMEIYGYVDAQGNLVDPGDESCVGRHLLSLDDYDFSELLALDMVKNIELRTRVGAYIPGYQQVYHEVPESPIYKSGTKVLMQNQDVIRFVLSGDEPYTIALQGNDLSQRYRELPIRVLEQANSLVQYPNEFALYVSNWDDAVIDRFADDIRRINGNDQTDSITLYPGVEYVMAVGYPGSSLWIVDPETGKYVWDKDEIITLKGHFHVGIGLGLRFFTYEEPRGLQYEPGFGLNKTGFPTVRKEPFFLHRYEDVKDDARWTEYVQSMIYDVSSFPVVMTQDISLIPAWFEDGMFLNEGRMITPEEYQSGAKVCMVSATLAFQQGWKIGDALELHLYKDTGVIDTPKDGILNATLLITDYMKDNGGFFEEDTYQIVGIFAQKEIVDQGGAAEAVLHNPINAIYIPENAAPNAPKCPMQAGVVTIELKNGSINAFNAAVEELGLTESKAGEYEYRFTCFDQGYGKIAGGLQEMHRNAKILLGLSAVLMLVTMVLTAFLFSRQHKHSAGILRMLGGSKRQAFTAILACAATVVTAGGIVGTALGGALTQSVGGGIMGDVESAAVELATGASLGLTILSGLGCMVLFLALTAIFTATYIGKEPRALLPKDQA